MTKIPFEERARKAFESDWVFPENHETLFKALTTAHLEAMIEELERVLDNLHDSTLEPKLNDRIEKLKAQLKGESDV